MLSKVASVVVRHRRLPTLAIRSHYREGAGEFLPEVGQRAIFLTKRDLITEGAHYVLCKQQAVTPDSMLAITGDTTGPLQRTCSGLLAAGRVRGYG
jgi:hypothetical protein